MKKSQTSMEFMSIMGIGFVLIALIGGIFFTVSNDARDNLDTTQIQNIGRLFIENIEKIYFQGSGNRITISASFPQDILNMTIFHGNSTSGQFDMLNITYVVGDEEKSQIYYPNELYIRFNCTTCIQRGNYSIFNESDYSPGAKNIRIESKGTFVDVMFVKE